jgi:hypothetical protein
LWELPFKFDIPADPHLPARVNRDHDVWNSAVQIELETPALELRAYKPNEETQRLFIRTEKGLDLLKPSEQTVSSLNS